LPILAARMRGLYYFSGIANNYGCLPLVGLLIDLDDLLGA